MTLSYDLKVRPTPPGMLEWEVNFWNGMDGRLSVAQQSAWDRAYGARNEAFLADLPIGEDLVRWKYQEYLKDYLRTIASIDDNVGRVLDYLDTSGLADNTLIVYTSDQGFYLGEHGWYDKRWIYEESLRTPMVMRWPGHIEASSATSALAANLDLAPTFLEVAGASVPGDMQGLSLVDLVSGESSALRDSFYYHYYESDGPHAVPVHYGVVTADHKLIHYPELGAWELFEIATDPHEVTNRYDDPAMSATRARLESELERLRSELDVPDDQISGANR